MKLRLDSAACVGHGRCYMLAPEIFDEDERGHCSLRAERVPPGLEAQARAGVEACPEGALELEAEAPG
jgi:ferredoxin